MRRQTKTLQEWYEQALFFYGTEYYPRGMLAHQRVKALAPGGFQDTLLDAIALLHTSQDKEALALIERATVLNPNESIAHAYKGTVLIILKENKAAWEALDRALHLDPDNVLALSEKSALALATQHYNEALACAKRALASGHANRATILFVKASALFHLSRLDEALVAVSEAARFAPSNILVQIAKTEILCHLKRFPEAAVAGEQALRVSLNSAASWSRFGALLLFQNLANDALLAYNRALLIRGNDAALFNGKGLALLDLGHLQQAVETFDHALQLAPDKEEIVHNRNIVLRAIREQEPSEAKHQQKREEVPPGRAAYNRLLARWPLLQRGIRLLSERTSKCTSGSISKGGSIGGGLLIIGIVFLLLVRIGGPPLLHILKSNLFSIAAVAVLVLYPAFCYWSWRERHRPGWNPRILHALQEGIPLPLSSYSPVWRPPQQKSLWSRLFLAEVSLLVGLTNQVIGPLRHLFSRKEGGKWEEKKDGVVSPLPVEEIASHADEGTRKEQE